MTHQHAIGARTDMLAKQFGARRKPAIGDNDRVRRNVEWHTVARYPDPGTAAAFHAQRSGPSAEKHAALALFEAPAQFAEHPIGPATLPVRPRDRRTGRPQGEAVPVDRTCLSEDCALNRQPIDCAACIGSNRCDEFWLRLVAGLPVDGGGEGLRVELHVVIRDVENAASPPRAAQIAISRTSFDHGRTQAEFGSPHCGA
jgi:hypothetical protein